MASKGHALSRDALIRTLTAYSGITTADGTGTTTLEDSNLIGRNDFISGKTILIMSGDAKDEDKGALSFATLTGVITLRNTGVSAQIKAGTVFRILNISSIEIDVADIQEDLGDMADAATNDNMGDITTTSALAKLRLLLNRMSTDAFTATIRGGARTELDTMLAEMAKYFVADGGVFDLKINNGVNRDNLNLILRDYFDVVGIMNTSRFAPRIFGAERTTFSAAFHALPFYWAPLDELLDIKMQNGTNKNTFKEVFKDYLDVVGCLNTARFAPRIFGAERTSFMAAFHALPLYWAPLDEQLDIKINNGTNKNDLKNILKDFFTMIGCLDTNIFNPIIGGSERTTFDAAFAAIGTIIGDPSGDTLADLSVKWGDIARSLDLILGARWDSTGDLGTDIAAIISAIATVDAVVDDISANVAAIINNYLGHGTHGLSPIRSALTTIDAIVDDISANLAAAINNYLGHGTHGLSPIRAGIADTRAVVDDILANVQAIINYLGHGTFGLAPIRAGIADTRAVVDDISANVAAIINNYLNNGTFGLSALNTDLDAIITALADGTYGLPALNTDLDAIISALTTVDAVVDDISANLAAAINNYLGHGTHGLSPIRSALTTIDAIVDDISANLAAAINNYLGHGTHGLSPIRSALTTIDAIVDDISANLAAAINNYLGHGTHGLAAIQALLANGTFGLSALNNDLDALIAALATVDTEVGDIEAKLDVQKGATGVFYEQADAALDVSVDNNENDLFDLSAASTRYIVRSLRVKCADPGAGETVTIRLYELINNVDTIIVDSFVIDHDNYMTYFSLMDMFGVPHLAGDDLRVVAIGSVAGPVALTGQYSHAKTNV